MAWRSISTAVTRFGSPSSLTWMSATCIPAHPPGRDSRQRMGQRTRATETCSVSPERSACAGTERAEDAAATAAMTSKRNHEGQRMG